jgi:hypothetical protein
MSLNLDKNLLGELPCFIAEQTHLFFPGWFVNILGSPGFDLDVHSPLHTLLVKPLFI